jgi:transcription initiation factor TFIIIB Brf1 subunit/transcription initiation factor TFIIB
MRNEEMNDQNCPICGGTKIVSDKNSGEHVCGTCGMVLNETLVDPGPEYRVFSLAESEDRRRTGTGYSYSIYDKGLSTVIKGDRDARGNKLDYETQRERLEVRLLSIDPLTVIHTTQPQLKVFLPTMIIPQKPQ